MCQISARSKHAFVFYRGFCKVCEKKKKRRKKNTKLWPLVSRKWLERFSSNLVCGLPYLAGISVATLVGATKVCKSRLLSSCKYTHGVARRLLGPHDTLSCVLINQPYICNCITIDHPATTVYDKTLIIMMLYSSYVLVL